MLTLSSGKLESINTKDVLPSVVAATMAATVAVACHNLMFSGR